MESPCIFEPYARMADPLMMSKLASQRYAIAIITIDLFPALLIPQERNALENGTKTAAVITLSASLEYGVTSFTLWFYG
jgi:hypothetical protein